MSQYLYEKIEIVKQLGMYKELPPYIKENLNPHFQMREYQESAIRNFVTYYETPSLHSSSNIHTLFHMATGSGKTFVMAAIILYLYEKGYRNFLFFVDKTQIVKKTIENFLNPANTKYLFAQNIVIKGKNIFLRQVENFQSCNQNNINILFDTTAGLHSDFTLIKENAPSIDDFLTDKCVLIADEAHHLNASTKKSENDEELSWEHTVQKIKMAHNENILLEFTATCDLEYPLIKEKYHDKIIVDYPLKKFRSDGFSKDIYMLKSDFAQTEDDRMYRVLQALILSQYRLKLFESVHLSIKPVVLIKSKTIKESEANKNLLINFLKNLKAKDIEKIKSASKESLLMRTAFEYFKSNDITSSLLVKELQRDFSSKFFIDVNDDKQLDNVQIIVNSLEDANNPYRVVFEVEKLDEGWDCLNLFDIVRMYETRDASKGRPGKSTVREAQLIGRGARYCPFILRDTNETTMQDKYKRKFDNDFENPLSVLEQLHYHCQKDSKYIYELNQALLEIGIDNVDESKKITRHVTLKESFLKDDLYKKGFVFSNKLEEKSYKQFGDVENMKKEYSYTFTSNISETHLMNETLSENKTANNTANEKLEHTQNKTCQIKMNFSQIIKKYGYNFVYFPLSKHKSFELAHIKRLFPAITSLKEFLTSKDYLGNVQISFEYEDNENVDTEKNIFLNMQNALSKCINEIQFNMISEQYNTRGSKKFFPLKLSNVFEDTGFTKNYFTNESGGEGVAQKDCSNKELQYDVTNKDWHVYSENYGTTEEKRFVKYFGEFVEPELKEKYSHIRLIRNEGKVRIYSFGVGENDGRAFEPDYLLYLKNKQSGEYEYTQVFIEPKGAHLLPFDKWKEDFLLELKENSVPTVQFKSDEKYKIWGLHFYCKGMRDVAFNADIKKLMEE